MAVRLLNRNFLCHLCYLCDIKNNNDYDEVYYQLQH